MRIYFKWKQHFYMTFLMVTVFANSYANEVRKNNNEDGPVIVTQNASYFFQEDSIGISIISRCASLYKVKKVEIDGENIALTNGQVTIMLEVGDLGQHEVPVKVTYTDKDKTRSRTYFVRYVVGMFTAAAALDKNDVLYIGVANPLSVSMSRAGGEQVQVSIAGGGGMLQYVEAGKLLVWVSQVTDDCRIYLQVNGKTKAEYKFKVRQLPEPAAFVGGYASGDSVDVNAFKAQTGVGLGIKNFAFELPKYEVVRFDLVTWDQTGQLKSVTSNGGEFSEPAKTMMNQFVKQGSMLVITNLVAKDATGRLFHLSPLVYYMK